MTVTALQRFDTNAPLVTKWAVWGVGAVFTYGFIASLGIENQAWAMGIAVLLQFVLTKAQRVGGILGFTSLVVDALLNFGGIWIYWQRIPGTETYINLADAFFFIPAEPNKTIMALFCLLLCAFIAKYPEA